MSDIARSALKARSAAWSIRQYQPRDFEAVLGTIRAASEADGDSYRPAAAELRARLAQPHADERLRPEDDSWVAEAPGDGIVAFADGGLTGSDSSDHYAYRTLCKVRPDFRRQGLGRALVGVQWARAQAIGRVLRPARVSMSTGVLDTQSGAASLFAECGLRAVRCFLEMRRDLDRPLPGAEPPGGMRLMPWSERPADLAIWEAMQEAFADHWGHAGQPFRTFVERARAGTVQREYSSIAWDGDEVVGGSINDFGPDARARRGPGLGWISIVFVRRAWRRHGLGRALVAASIQQARSLGHTHVGLNVDSENQFGAVRLYEALDFSVARRRLIYQRTVPA